METHLRRLSEDNRLLAGRAVESPVGGVSISSRMKDRALPLRRKRHAPQGPTRAEGSFSQNHYNHYIL